MTYPAVKATGIDLVDDFSPKDVVQDYGIKYNAGTKLLTIGLSDPVRSVMPVRVNKRMRQLGLAVWKDVGPMDTVACQTLGDFINLLCRKSQTAVPDGEPA